MTDQPRPTDQRAIDREAATGRTTLVPKDRVVAPGPIGVFSFPRPGLQLSIEQLILDYHAVIYRYAYRLTGRQQDAEDLTQQTFMVAQQKLAQVREPAKVVAWLCAVLRSRYVKMVRKPFPIAAINLELEVDEIPDVSDDDSIDHDQLQTALDQIPDEFKLVLLAFYFEECSYQEIAVRLKIPVGTVMSRLSRGKARLRALLLKADSADVVPSSLGNALAISGRIATGLASRGGTHSAAVVFSKPSLQSPGGEIFARISHG